MPLKPEIQKNKSSLPSLKEYYRVRGSWLTAFKVAAGTAIGAMTLSILTGCERSLYHTVGSKVRPKEPNQPNETKITGIAPPVMSETNINQEINNKDTQNGNVRPEKRTAGKLPPPKP